jgi:hypothetical protein
LYLMQAMYGPLPAVSTVSGVVPAEPVASIHATRAKLLSADSELKDSMRRHPGYTNAR